MFKEGPIVQTELSGEKHCFDMLGDDFKEFSQFEIAHKLLSKYGPTEEIEADDEKRAPLSERTLTEKDESEPLADDPITPEIRAQIDKILPGMEVDKD